MNSRTSGRLARRRGDPVRIGTLGRRQFRKTVAGKKVNINQASARELVNLPRIGAKAADKIVEYRQAHGSFTKVEDLMESRDRRSSSRS
jgi:competence protein ComEA